MNTTTATRNGRKPRQSVSKEQVWEFARSRESLTSGDVMREFDVSRAQARERLESLARLGHLQQQGTGAGSKYVSNAGRTADATARMAGPGPGRKPAESTPASLLDKLVADCDSELEPLARRLDEIAAQMASLEQERASIKTQAAPIERARKALAAAT